MCGFHWCSFTSLFSRQDFCRSLFVWCRFSKAAHNEIVFSGTNENKIYRLLFCSLWFLFVVLMFCLVSFSARYWYIFAREYFFLSFFFSSSFAAVCCCCCCLFGHHWSSYYESKLFVSINWEMVTKTITKIMKNKLMFWIKFWKKKEKRNMYCENVSRPGWMKESPGCCCFLFDFFVIFSFYCAL